MLTGVGMLFLLCSAKSQTTLLDSLRAELPPITSEMEFQQYLEYFDVVKIERSKGDFLFPKSYENLATQALNYALGTQDQEAILEAKLLLFSYYTNLREEVEIISRAKELLTFGSLYDSKELIEVLYQLRESYRRTEQYLKLLEVQELSILHEKRLRLDSIDIPISNYSSLGYVYYNLKNFRQAAGAFKKHADELQSTELYFNLASAQNNIGLSYLNLMQLDSASAYFKLARENIANEIRLGHPDNLEYVLHFDNVVESNLAKILIINGDLAMALPALMAELRSNVRTIAGRAGPAYYNVANLLYRMDQHQKALAYVDSALMQYATRPKSPNLIEALELKGKCLMALGRWREANVFFQEKDALSDSLDRATASRNYILATVEHETQKKERQLRESKMAIEVQRQTSRLMKFGLLFLIILLSILIYLFKKTRRDKILISQQKDSVGRALQEKELLLKEIHHRVKNNLEMVKSLIELQSAQLSDQASIDVMLASQNRVQSMGIIHQKLYQGENLGAIEMKDYFINLGEGILDAYDSEEKINIKCHMDELILDVDTAVPIGLIVNELLTNAIKYAFPKERNGVIDVELSRLDSTSLKLRIADNGVGRNIHADPEGSGFGMQLVQMLTQQLNGQMSETFRRGTEFNFTFRSSLVAKHG
jgi:two-component sensor histidine kinase